MEINKIFNKGFFFGGALSLAYLLITLVIIKLEILSGVLIDSDSFLGLLYLLIVGGVAGIPFSLAYYLYYESTMLLAAIFGFILAFVQFSLLCSLLYILSRMIKTDFTKYVILGSIVIGYLLANYFVSMVFALGYSGW